MVKASLDVFNLRQEHVWTASVLDDYIYEMKRVTVESGQQGIITRRSFLLYFYPW